MTMTTNEESVKLCYAHEDDNEALECIKGVVKNPAPGSCAPRLVLLVREGCDGCRQEKEHYKDEIASGLVTTVDIFSEKGVEIARKNQIDFVPALLVVDCGDKAIE
jgi:hypothetical protein